MASSDKKKSGGRTGTGAKPAAKSDTSQSSAGQTDTGQANETASSGGASSAAEEVIAKFGGIRPMATKLDVPVSTVQGWKERGAIPESHHADILKAAAANTITLEASLLKSSATPSGESPSMETAKSGTAQDASAKESSTKDTDAKPQAPAKAGSSVPPSGSTGKAAATPKPATEKAGSSAASIQVSSPSKGASVNKPDMTKSPAKDSEAAKSAAGKPGASQAGPDKTPTKSSASQSPPPAKRGGGLGAFLLGAVVLAAGAAGAVVTRDVWLPYLGAGQTEQADVASAAAVNANSEALKALQQRVQSLENAPAPAAAGTSAFDQQIKDLQGQLAALDSANKSLTQQVDDLAKRPAADTSAGTGSGSGTDTSTDLSAVASAAASAAASANANAAELAKLTGEVQALSQKQSASSEKIAALESLPGEVKHLADLQSGATRAAGKEIALLLASLQLRDALQGSGPFQQELTAVEPLVSGQAATDLAALQPYAADGIPTLSELQASFGKTASAAVATDPTTEGDSWGDAVLNRISSIVTIRPVGMPEGDSTGAIVARAETKLNRGDLAGALTELGSLTGPAKEAVADWEHQAQGRRAADTALGALSAAVSQQFTTTGG